MKPTIRFLYIFILSFCIPFSVKANESDQLKKLDVLIFLSTNTQQNCPFQLVNDLNGDLAFVHTDRSRPIKVNISAITSESFDVWRDERGYQSPRKVNRVKVLSEIVGREATDDYKEIVALHLKNIGIERVEFQEFYSPSFGCGLNDSHISLFLRVDMDLNVYGPYLRRLLDNGQIIPIGVLGFDEFFRPVANKIENEFVDVRRSIELLDTDPVAVGALIKHEQYANYLKVKSPGPCVVRPKDENERIAKVGFRIGEKVYNRFGFSKDGNFHQVVKSVDELWSKIQINECNVSFINGEEFGKLRKALENDRSSYYRIELASDFSITRLSYIKHQGYKDSKEYEFAQTFMPVAKATEIHRLSAYGIDDVEKLNALKIEILQNKYTNDEGLNIALIAEYLADKDAGSKIGLSANQHRAKRVADERENRRRQAARLARQESERANKSFRLGVVCMGDDLAKTLMQNIIQLYASNTHASAIASYVRGVPGCLFPAQSSNISGSRLAEFYRSGSFVGVRTRNAVNGQLIYGMVNARDWDGN